MTQKTHWLSISVIATILLTSTIVPNYFAYADDDDDDDDDDIQTLTKLQKKCQKEPKNPIKIKADCELLNKINNLETELKAKDAELMAKDMELMDKDALLEANTDITCAALPVVKSAFGSITSTTATAFGTVNTGIGILNTSVIGPLNAFNLKEGRVSQIYIFFEKWIINVI